MSKLPPLSGGAKSGRASVAAVVAFASAADNYGGIKISTTPYRNQDLLVAEEEMQRANYFAYVMLINLAPPDLFQGNVTFLMPNDKTLAASYDDDGSNTSIGIGPSVSDFLLRHSIPSPLMFEHLEHIPSGSILPTSKPGQIIRVNNKGGRRGIYLNNVRIISPNICNLGSSIKCHGIDGVIRGEYLTETPGTPPPECKNDSTSSQSPSGGSGANSAASPPPENNNSNNKAAPPVTADGLIKSAAAASAYKGVSQLVILGLAWLCFNLLWVL